MSYIEAHVLEGRSARTVNDEVAVMSGERPDLSMDLDFEMLDFVLALIAKVGELGEGETLVVRKVIF